MSDLYLSNPQVPLTPTEADPESDTPATPPSPGVDPDMPQAPLPDDTTDDQPMRDPETPEGTETGG
jgi:hypothetical protein